MCMQKELEEYATETAEVLGREFKKSNIIMTNLHRILLIVVMLLFIVIVILSYVVGKQNTAFNSMEDNVLSHGTNQNLQCCVDNGIVTLDINKFEITKIDNNNNSYTIYYRRLGIKSRQYYTISINK